MLGLFGPEVVSFFAMSGSSLFFYSTRAKKPDTDTKVRVPLVGYKVNRVDIPLRILASQPTGKGHLCEGWVDMSPEHLRQLEDLLYSSGERADLGETARRSPRIPTGLKASGRDLPGYNGVAADISQHGILLNCHGELHRGQPLEFSLETDMSSLPSFGLKGRVIWCHDKGKSRGYQVGIDFQGMSRDQTDILNGYVRNLLAGQSANMLQRQIGDGQFTSEPGEAPPVLREPPPPPPS